MGHCGESDRMSPDWTPYLPDTEGIPDVFSLESALENGSLISRVGEAVKPPEHLCIVGRIV